MAYRTGSRKIGLRNLFTLVVHKRLWKPVDTVDYSLGEHQ